MNERDKGRLTAVVTGATGGIGLELTRGLLRHGAAVIIGVRSAGKATGLAHEPGQLEVLQLDVSNMKSVRAFAEAVSRTHSSLQLLINNAGAWFSDRRETAEGRELTLATNLLGPHLLTHQLLPLLRAGAPSRVVNVVSSAAGHYDLDDLEWEKRRYDGFKAYAQSKQALRMATWKLAQRLEGTGVVANAADPGFVKTGFIQNATGLVATMIRLTKIFASSPERGAATPLRVALAPELRNANGRLFAGHQEKPGGFREQAPLDELERRLDELTGVSR